jgi:hypothetical protein
VSVGTFTVTGSRWWGLACVNTSTIEPRAQPLHNGMLHYCLFCWKICCMLIVFIA